MTRAARSGTEQHALITGGAGFIGSHLAEALLAKGYRVTVIDDLSTGSFDNIAHLADNPYFAFALDSIANEVVLDRLASECSVIFHLAAAVGVKLIVENLIGSIETNILGSEAVLKAGARYRVKVLLASSSEVYGKGNRVPFHEDDDVVIGPTTRSRWAYAAAKMVDEFLALAYHREKGLPVVIFRLFNTVGPRQTGQYGMVIPRLVEQALSGQPLTVYGDGRQSRCFMHVGDAVAALIALAECPQAVGKVFNVGSTESVTVLELAQRILTLVDEGEPSRQAGGHVERIVLVPYEEAYTVGFEDMPRRVPDIARIAQYTGWQPTYSLDATLRSVVASAQSRKTGNS